jgi:hypothetical protein
MSPTPAADAFMTPEDQRLFERGTGREAVVADLRRVIAHCGTMPETADALEVGQSGLFGVLAGGVIGPKLLTALYGDHGCLLPPDWGAEPPSREELPVAERTAPEVPPVAVNTASKVDPFPDFAPVPVRVGLDGVDRTKADDAPVESSSLGAPIAAAPVAPPPATKRAEPCDCATLPVLASPDFAAARAAMLSALGAERDAVAERIDFDTARLAALDTARNVIGGLSA